MTYGPHLPRHVRPDFRLRRHPRRHHADPLSGPGQALLRPRGIPFPEDRFYALGGMPTAQIIRLLAGECGVAVPDVEAMVWEKERMFLAELHGVTPITPVVQIAESFPQPTSPMAVASGGYR